MMRAMHRFAIVGAAAVVAVVVGSALVVVGAGIFWLFLFGDDPWPHVAEIALVTLGYGAGLLAGAATLMLLIRSDRRAE
jgi:hypothetical protein